MSMDSRKVPPLTKYHTVSFRVSTFSPSVTRQHLMFDAFILRLSLHMQCARGKYRFSGSVHCLIPYRACLKKPIKTPVIMPQLKWSKNASFKNASSKPGSCNKSKTVLSRLSLISLFNWTKMSCWCKMEGTQDIDVI